MKKFNLTLVLLIGFALSAKAQQTTVSSGGDIHGDTGTLSFSLGQVHFNTYSSSSMAISEGIQQIYEVRSLSTGLSTEPFSLAVYPNPASDYLTINFRNQFGEGYNFQLYDLNGKMIINRKISGEKTIIDLRKYASAIYILNLYKDNSKIQSFKILKN